MRKANSFSAYQLRATMILPNVARHILVGLKGLGLRGFRV